MIARRERPCLMYHIGKCCAPCSGNVSREEYHKLIDEVLSFLSGNTSDILRSLNEQMTAAAEAMDFERAAIIRDRIRAIDSLNEKQAVIATDSWVPTDFRDRPVVVNGVRLSPNHGVKHDDAQRVEAIEASRTRGMIDGRAYHHVLVAEHSWLLARDGEGHVYAESLWLTPDMKLGRAYPEIAARHAAVNLGGVEVAA